MYNSRWLKKKNVLVELNDQFLYPLVLSCDCWKPCKLNLFDLSLTFINTRDTRCSSVANICFAISAAPRELFSGKVRG